MVSLEEIDFKLIYKDLRKMFHHRSDMRFNQNDIETRIYDFLKRYNLDKRTNIDYAQKIFNIIEHAILTKVDLGDRKMKKHLKVTRDWMNVYTLNKTLSH